MAKRPSSTRRQPPRRSAPKQRTGSESEQAGRRRIPWGGWIFAVALLVRLLFWQATPDATWSHTAFYKGDAPIWLDYARALQGDFPFELGLPLRPPGNAYLLATLWGGEVAGLAWMKGLWCLLGAATASLFYLAARRSFGLLAGCVVGFGMALGHGWMVLSTSLNNETPYLFLVGLALVAWPAVADTPSAGRLLAWGGLHALACLLRVEHALFFALLMLVAMGRWLRATDDEPARRRLAWGRGFRYAALVGVAYGLVLTPWHAAAWQACRQFNRVEPEVNPATERFYREVERALVDVVWTPDAEEERRRLPAASRRAMGNFVAATVFVRGGREVTAADFELLEEAFGTRPTPLSEHPFIALYGGLNFYLANNPHLAEGFSRGPLDDPPPLTGGIQRYPALLIGGLPPPDLALTYPPHLDIVNHGYGKGLAWIRQQPTEFAAHAGRKLRVFWDGATLGFGGYDLPFGTSGLRRKVDLVVPRRTPMVNLWQAAWLAILGIGVWRLVRSKTPRRHWQAFAPWGLWLGSKVVVTVAFFGYARQGVGVAPVLWLLLALALGHGLESRPWRRAARRGAYGWVGVMVLIELVRFLHPPALLLDGRRVDAADPWPLQHHEQRLLEVDDG